MIKHHPNNEQTLVLSRITRKRIPCIKDNIGTGVSQTSFNKNVHHERFQTIRTELRYNKWSKLCVFGILEVSMSIECWTGRLQVRSHFGTAQIGQ